MPKSKYIATTSKRSNTPNAQSKSIAHNTEAVNPNKILIPQKALVKKIGENKKLNALKVDRELRRGEQLSDTKKNTRIERLRQNEYETLGVIPLDKSNEKKNDSRSVLKKFKQSNYSDQSIEKQVSQNIQAQKKYYEVKIDENTREKDKILSMIRSNRKKVQEMKNIREKRLKSKAKLNSFTTSQPT